jgi:hypothetical protein
MLRLGGDQVQIPGHVRRFTEHFPLPSRFLPFRCCLFGASLTCPAAVQYPYGQDDDGQHYSGYDDQVHGGVSDTGYSVCVIILYLSAGYS